MVERDALVCFPGAAPAGPVAVYRSAAEPVAVEETTSTDATDRSQQLEALAAEVGPMALAIAHSMLGDRASAEDALQDAYLQAYRGLLGFRGEASQRTWFLKILINSCRRHRRIWRRWTATQEQVSREPSDTNRGACPDPALRERISAAVTGLPHRQRTAFVLRYLQDLGIDEIAEVMGCATGTVKATIHKAVIKLRRELGDTR